MGRVKWKTKLRPLGTLKKRHKIIKCLEASVSHAMFRRSLPLSPLVPDVSALLRRLHLLPGQPRPDGGQQEVLPTRKGFGRVASPISTENLCVTPSPPPYQPFQTHGGSGKKQSQAQTFCSGLGTSLAEYYTQEEYNRVMEIVAKGGKGGGRLPDETFLPKFAKFSCAQTTMEASAGPASITASTGSPTAPAAPATAWRTSPGCQTTPTSAPPSATSSPRWTDPTGPRAPTWSPAGCCRLTAGPPTGSTAPSACVRRQVREEGEGGNAGTWNLAFLVVTFKHRV